MNIPSPPITQKSWILGDVADDEDCRVHKQWVPLTPQSLFVSEKAESFGQFLSLSDNARSRASYHQKKRADSSIARSIRRKSIFDSVTSALLLDPTEEPRDDHETFQTQSESIASYSEVNHKTLLREDGSKGRYRRRGSCTKFSLEAELLGSLHTDSDVDEDGSPKFKSFRRNETLQADDVYSEIEDERRIQSKHYLSCQQIPPPSGSTNGTYAPMKTIDQLPLPMKESLHRRNSINHLPVSDNLPVLTTTRSRSTPRPSRPPKTKFHTTQASPQRIRVPKPRHVPNLSTDAKCSSSRGQSRDSKTASSGKALSHTTTSNESKKIFSKLLPTAPFLNDAYDLETHGKMTSHHSQTEDKPETHPGAKNNQGKTRDPAPKFGSLLKRLQIQRNDSLKSFAEEGECEEGSYAPSKTEPWAQPKGVLMSVKPSCRQPAPESPNNGKMPAWRRYSLTGSNHSRTNGRSPSPVPRLLSPKSEAHYAPHNRKTSHRLNRQELAEDGGPDQPGSNNHKKKLLPPTHLPPVSSKMTAKISMKSNTSSSIHRRPENRGHVPVTTIETIQMRRMDRRSSHA